MNERQPWWPDGPSDWDRYEPTSTPSDSAPTEQFPTAGLPGSRFAHEQTPTEQFLPVAREDRRPTQRFEAGPYGSPQGESRPYETPQVEPGPHGNPQFEGGPVAPRAPQPYEQQRFAEPYRPAPPYGRPEPLAHEGGYPYGMPPAAPYGAPAPYGPADQFIPQHLHVPPQQMPHAPYPHQFGPPPMQQTVFVNAGYPAKRVNHVLHLILTLFTAGLWLPVWIILSIANS